MTEEVPLNDLNQTTLTPGCNNNNNNKNTFDTCYKLSRLKITTKKLIHSYMRFLMPKTITKRRYDRDEVDNALDNAEDYFEEYSCYPPKLGMTIISVIIVVCFTIDEIKKTNAVGKGPTAAIFIFKPFKKVEIWRYFTYIFVHIGHLHMIFNLIFQLLLGVPLEMVHGWWRVLLTYLTGAIAGSLASSITDPESLLAGASGGVYSLISAHMATIIMNWNEMWHPSALFLIFFILATADNASAIYRRFWLTETEGVSCVAHTAGAVTGLLFGIFVLRILVYNSRVKIVVYWSAVTLFIILMLVAIILNILGISL